MIHDELADEVFDAAHRGGPKYPLYLHVSNFPSLNYQLVSRRFRREFLEKAMKKAQITLQDAKFYHPGSRQDFTLPSILLQCPKVKLHLLAYCFLDFVGWSPHGCGAVERLHLHAVEVLDFVSKFQDLKHLEINFYLIAYHDEVMDCVKQVQAQLSMLFPKLVAAAYRATIKVFQDSVDVIDWGTCQEYDLSGVMKLDLVSEYSHETGGLVHVQKKQDCNYTFPSYELRIIS